MPATYIAHAPEAMKIIMLENSPVMLGIMSDAFKHLSCSKLCRHNLSRPSHRPSDWDIFAYDYAYWLPLYISVIDCLELHG